MYIKRPPRSEAEGAEEEEEEEEPPQEETEEELDTKPKPGEAIRSS